MQSRSISTGSHTDVMGRDSNSWTISEYAIAFAQANGLPARKRLSKAQLRALEAKQNGKKSGKTRRMSAIDEDGGKASRKRPRGDAGKQLFEKLQVLSGTGLCIGHHLP